MFDFILPDFCAINNVENETNLRRVELFEMVNLFSDKRNHGIDRNR